MRSFVYVIIRVKCRIGNVVSILRRLYLKFVSIEFQSIRITKYQRVIINVSWYMRRHSFLGTPSVSFYLTYIN